MEYLPNDVALSVMQDKSEKLQVVHMYCATSIDNCGMRVLNKFYEDKFEKSYLLGKIEAYKAIKEIIELPLQSGYPVSEKPNLK